jgi:secreted trypsin-like serine protease
LIVGLCVIFAFFGAAQAKPDGSDIEVVILREETDVVNPEFLTPKDFEYTLLSNETSGSLNSTLFTPKMTLDRATTDCGCGYAVSNPSPAAGRIVNGQVVDPQNKLPYQVKLLACWGQSCGACGGTLINKKYVLTAMHCVSSKGATADYAKVTIGEFNTATNGESIPQQDIIVSRIIERSDYNERTINNDIALLQLSTDAVFNDNVVPACLPTDVTKMYENQNAVVSGWGTTSFGGSSSNKLKETTVEILPSSNAACTPYGSLGNGKMCAYTEGTDSCQGDSGGPLVLKEDGRYTVVGVVSYGNGCATPGFGGIYARVTNYLDWINSNVADGWCGGSSPTVAPTTAAPTGATTAATTAAPTTAAPTGATTANPTLGTPCDFSCYGPLQGTYDITGFIVECNQGICSAIDGSDICQIFGYPCGAPSSTSAPTTTVPPTSTNKPGRKGRRCNLKCLVGKFTGEATFNGIAAKCRRGRCRAIDGSNLCKALGNPCKI